VVRERARRAHDGVAQMQVLTAHERNVADLARSLRTAVVVPSLFALALLVIRQPAVAGFAVFGTFAHQVLVNYDPRARARFAQCGLLTLLGVITVSLGTLASANPWLAVSGTLLAGFVSELPALTRGRIAAIRQALLVSFLCAVAVPSPVRSLFPHVAGWLMAGVMAQPALLLIWIPLQHVSVAGEGANSNDGAANAVTAERSVWTGTALRAGLALGAAILLTRLIDVQHAFWVVLGVLPLVSASGGRARTFWQEQIGTLIGLAISALLVATIGQHQAWYWLILPVVVFGSTYAASAIGFIAGQAAFTVFAVTMFCILIPQARQTGILRLADIAMGGAVSLVVGSLLRLGKRRAVDRLRSAVKA
jgi:Fusaric acid resistance protein-like